MTVLVNHFILPNIEKPLKRIINYIVESRKRSAKEALEISRLERELRRNPLDRELLIEHTDPQNPPPADWVRALRRGITTGEVVQHLAYLETAGLLEDHSLFPETVGKRYIPTIRGLRVARRVNQ